MSEVIKGKGQTMRAAMTEHKNGYAVGFGPSPGTVVLVEAIDGKEQAVMVFTEASWNLVAGSMQRAFAAIKESLQ